MRFKRWVLLGVFVSGVLVEPMVSPAASIIGNLSTATFDVAQATANGDSVGIGFKMGTAAYALGPATVQLFVPSSLTDSYRLSLYNNDLSNNPGSALFSFISPTFQSNVFGPYTFAPSGSFTLQPNTVYWLVLTYSSDSTNQGDVLGNLHNVVPTGPGASYVGGRVGGTPPTSPVPINNGVPVIFNFGLEGTPLASVPEPSSLIMAGIAAVTGLGCWRCRRTMKALV